MEFTSLSMVFILNFCKTKANFSMAVFMDPSEFASSLECSAYIGAVHAPSATCDTVSQAP